MVKAGRPRLPPARIRWLATSVRYGSSVRTELRSASSTRARSCGMAGNARRGLAEGTALTIGETDERTPIHPTPPPGAPSAGRPTVPGCGDPPGLSPRARSGPWSRRQIEAGMATLVAQSHLSGGSSLFERFTDRARRVVVLAQEEARLLNHNYIGTEHILLGLIHEGEGVAAKALESLGISLEAVRSQVEEII